MSNVANWRKVAARGVANSAELTHLASYHTKNANVCVTYSVRFHETLSPASGAFHTSPRYCRQTYQNIRSKIRQLRNFDVCEMTKGLSAFLRSSTIFHSNSSVLRATKAGLDERRSPQTVVTTRPFKRVILIIFCLIYPSIKEIIDFNPNNVWYVKLWLFGNVPGQVLLVKCCQLTFKAYQFWRLLEQIFG